MLFDLLYWNFAFLRTGTVGLTAQAYGALRPPSSPAMASSYQPSPSALSAILTRALRIALWSGLALIGLQWAVIWLAFQLVVCTPEVQELATQYFRIRIWAAPATLSLFAFKGWFVGLQDTVRPMVADLLVNGLNILLSIGLGFGLCGLPQLGFAGIAVGTVAAQCAGFAYALSAAVLRHGWRYTGSTRSRRHARPAGSHPEDPLTCKDLRPSPNSQHPSNGPLSSDWHVSHCESSTSQNLSAQTGADNNQQVIDSESLPCHTAQKTIWSEGGFWRMNGNLVLRSVGMIAVYIGFTVLAARYGDMVLAVSAILMKLLMLLSYFTDGFAFAGEALTGRFIGEGSQEGVRATVRGTFAWGFGLAAAFMLLYGLGGMPLLRLMSADPAVVDFGRAFLPWLLVMPLMGTPAFVWDGIFIGATESVHLRNSTLLCAVGFFAVWFAGTALLHPTGAAALHLLMAAYFMHLAIRTLYLTLAWPRRHP